MDYIEQILTSLRFEDIKEGISIPRNRALVYAFTYMNIMEHWGSGIPRIFKRCQELGLKEPGLMEIAGSFRMNLYRSPDRTRTGDSPDENTEGAKKVRISTDKNAKSTEKVRISMDEDVRSNIDLLNESQKRIIRYAEHMGRITNSEVQDLLSVKDSRALKILKDLVEL